MTLLPCDEWFNNFLPFGQKISIKNVQRVEDPYIEMVYNYGLQGFRYGSVLACGVVVPLFRAYMYNYHPYLRHQRLRTPVRNILRGTFYSVLVAAPLVMYVETLISKPSREQLIGRCIGQRTDPRTMYVNRSAVLGGLLGSVSHRMPGFVWGCAIFSFASMCLTKVFPPKPFLYPVKEDMGYANDRSDVSVQSNLEQPPQAAKQWTKHLFREREQNISNHFEEFIRK